MKTRKPKTKQARSLGPNKLTSPEAIRRALELADAGRSLREVAATLKQERLADVSPMTIARLVAKQPGNAANAAPSPMTPDDMPAAVSLADVPADAPIAMLQERLGTLRGLVARLVPAVEAGKYPPTAWVTLIRCETELAARIVALTPIAPADPSLDIGNRAAADALVAKIERSVRAAEERSFCQHCGKRPW